MAEKESKGTAKNERLRDGKSSTSWSFCIALVSCILYISIMGVIVFSEAVYEGNAETASTLLLAFVLNLLFLLVLGTPLLLLVMFLLNLLGVVFGIHEVKSTENPSRRSVAGLFINTLFLMLLAWFSPRLLMPL